MSRMLRDINVGVAIMVGVTSGYYIYEPLVRKHAQQRAVAEAELAEAASAAEEPLEHVRKDVHPGVDAPITSWLSGRSR